MFEILPPIAYIDPGSGSILLQALIAGTAGLFVFLRYQRGRLAAFLGSLRGKRSGPSSPDAEN